MGGKFLVNSWWVRVLLRFMELVPYGDEAVATYIDVFSDAWALPIILFGILRRVDGPLGK